MIVYVKLKLTPIDGEEREKGDELDNSIEDEIRDLEMGGYTTEKTEVFRSKGIFPAGRSDFVSGIAHRIRKWLNQDPLPENSRSDKWLEELDADVLDKVAKEIETIERK